MFKVKIRAAEELLGDKPLLELLPFQPLKAEFVLTGSEVVIRFGFAVSPQNIGGLCLIVPNVGSC